MFIPNDGITEIVAHFIGYFEIRAEDARYRPDFREFSQAPERQPAEGSIDPHRLDFREALNLASFVPEVTYVPPTFAVGPASLTHSVSFDPISVPIPDAAPAVVAPQTGQEGSPATMVMPMAEALGPGSTILILSQVKYLMDDDVLVAGDHEFQVAPRLASHAELEGLAARALDVSADLADLSDLRSVKQMVHLVEDASAMARDLSEDDFAPLDSLFLKVSGRIDGHFSNGATVEKPVTIAKAFAAPEEEGDEAEADPSPPQTASLTIDAATTPTTMTISSGGNVSWNEAAIVNAGLPSSVVAVAGDYHRIDAIYQTNVLRDVDEIDEAWPAENISTGGNVVQNGASFVNQSYEERTGDAPGGGGGFPQNWNVTTVDGDMIFLSWVQQYNFTLDNDTQILTAMGTNTVISSGLNLGFNVMSFVNLGLYYDLVFIGGSLYDGNFISQTNVLLDSDRLKVWGDSSASKGDVATGENVLWNEAAIENVGPGGWTPGLPSHYREAATELAAGNRQMPDGFRSDDALDGLGNLKVLYIAGDVYDIHSINQVNVVGDADDLAIYEASLLKAQDSVWQVSTGHNMLVNKAKILDYDSLGKTGYVGGEIYSDAVLVQAEIVEGLSDRLTVRGDALANEVIAFLDDHTDLSARFDDHPVLKTMADTGATYDVMHSVLA